MEDVVPVAEDSGWQYVPEVMSVRLGHLVHLLESCNSGALPFPRNVDPQRDLRWLFVGFTIAPAPENRQ